MALTNAQRDKVWIDMINGKCKTAGGEFIRTKADLLKVKQYLPMLSAAVKAAYEKRMAQLKDSLDSVDDIKEKYCMQTDVEVHMTATELANKLKEYFNASMKYRDNPKAQAYWHDKLRDTLATARYDASRMAKLVNEYSRKMDANGL